MTLTAALVGTGNIARHLHIPAHRGLANSRLKWVCDVNEENARAFAAMHGIPLWTVDLEEVLADEEVDWVDIATPNRTHEPLTVEALKAGKHVLCQKPMAHSLEAAEHMIRTAVQEERQLGLYMSFRSDPVLEQLRTMIRDGVLGKPISYRGKMISSGGYGLSTDQWRQQDAAGALDLLGIHLIDLFEWMQGEIQWTQALSQTLYAPMKGDDVTTALYGFPGGVTAVMEVTYCAFTGQGTPMYTLEMNGTEGSAVYRIETGELTLQLKRNYECRLFSYTTGMPESYVFDNYESKANVHKVHQAFADSIQDGQPFFIDGKSGWRAMQVMSAVRRSSSEQKREWLTQET